MFDCTTQPLGDDALQILDIRRNGAPMTFAEVIEGWRRDESFRSVFLNLLAEPPFTAYRWETPPVTAENATRTFECVFLDCPELNRDVDERAFTDQFAAADDAARTATFPNFGRDAILVAPCPRAPASMYGHLASFTRAAPLEQNHALWKAVGDAAAARLGNEPVWISTAGLGVIWLHVRLDDRPKYYGHEPYCKTP